MAVDTPVLESRTRERSFKEVFPSRVDYYTEQEHNARIKETYARLIDPKNRIEDVFDSAAVKEVEAQPEITAKPVENIQPAQKIEAESPYLVQNARANAAIFRADNPIYARPAEQNFVSDIVIDEIPEEENEDLRPTPTTIQYQTIGKASVKESSAVTSRKSFAIGKREKIIIAIFVAVVVALLALVIINSAVINNLNADISNVQSNITTVKGALAGVTSNIEEAIRDGMGR